MHQIPLGCDKDNTALGGGILQCFRHLEAGYIGHINVQKQYIKSFGGKIMQKRKAVGIRSDLIFQILRLQKCVDFFFSKSKVIGSSSHKAIFSIFLSLYLFCIITEI